MKTLGLILLTCLLFACNQRESSLDYSDASYKTEQASYDETEEQQQPGKDIQAEDRKIIKTADIRFQVTDLLESTKRIEAITAQYSGFLSSMNQTNSTYSINNSLTIRIPSDKLDAFILEVEKESVFTNYKRINAQDVTEEFVDISSRLATKKEVRDRYIEILRNQARTVKDILDAEEKIRVIQEEIESIEGRLKYLNNRTALSTINVELYQEVEYTKAPPTYKKSFFTKLKEGFSNGWDLILDIAVGIVNIWPIILIIVLIFLMRKRIKNPFRRK